ncbi:MULTISPECIES: beta-ketoacyl synthase N-terminal-like domain-containing protein [Chryseobacterium]|uniref:3-oxoacyl-(Acyl-carrier-protein) synthase n=1 Tax=Chryseobacterium camelliae TaxID=1265445 RepID=A0ABU0TMA3_9FLAO|nr:MULTISPECIES: beta-ketoacyl synthase N-terminal-like domain-containing protein [Chryseobacterium]MDT3408225.1 3-oxoacyl-(acyl-carrier-protein) synthase [Pseudacidovorax intermedius]MDQ1097921.1 3-oxoacyl-(acyl-carrier-protein) synthase [Chryseobacterium camelliae]MDQ1101852.1 3-oxoacyl-(acyl-carrier-protein) synthase [Chryseobacterium sp. SORGH_AS_1048]MDR6085292.1 3-oxoacyl-(acyl-carrier-protein) synthase [Chryseobacterium sp. SORGH_AS_0909]MDR6129649.1 3-oxoacyl-(acyl-carrier-protein) syn
MKKQTFITDYNCVTPLGFDTASNWENLISGNSGIAPHPGMGNQGSFYASIIPDERLNEEFDTYFDHADFTRLEKMLLLSLKPLVERHRITEHTGLILSTTKGNITLLKNQPQLPEGAYLSVLAQKIADHFGFATKPVVISNACVSGVMAVAVAKNMIAAGRFADAFVIAGDEVSEFVLSGFNSFQAIAPEPCKPYDASRNGINLGEAAAAAYVTSSPPGTAQLCFKILGDSSVNDANHISGPSRTGDGLYASITHAMKEAGITPEAIDFISAHGTATLYNDEMESIAFGRAGLQSTPLHSLKGFYGHCLGASGLLESIIAMESALRGTLIKSKNFQANGVSGTLDILRENRPAGITRILKTASGFGGCNAALVLEKRSTPSV